MNKLKSTIKLIFTFLITLTISSCAKEEPHTVHRWSYYTRTENTHSRKCLVCGEVEEEEHVDYVCETCADFKILSLGFVEGGDEAHSDFAKEANEWFPKMGKENGFLYDFSTDWGKLNDETLENYDLVIFLNNLPSNKSQREAFENYMENGGAFLGFHVCAFTTNASGWDWYHNVFLGSGNFKSNTWNPTKELIKVETHDYFATEDLPDTFMSSYNEWYAWSNDLTQNEDITILMSLDERSYPVGDKQGEIWTEGYYPVAWTNNNYKMVYLNLGHNLMYYNTYEKESKTFECEELCQFVINAMYDMAYYN